MAETVTSVLKLSKRDTGDLNWGVGFNANLDVVDRYSQQRFLRPPRVFIATLGAGAVGANLLGSTTYFYKITARNAQGESTESQIPTVLEAQVTESVTPVPILLSWEITKGAIAYRIYKSTVSGTEQFLVEVAGESIAVYTDSGSIATSGTPVPIVDTARTSVTKIIAGTSVTITPVDGTGDVTINATVPVIADASDTVKGVTKLSLAPVSPVNPIAVGDNDLRNTNARTPTGAASGDLGGTYPSPAVAKLGTTGVSVVVNTAAPPIPGQVLQAISPIAAAWATLSTTSTAAVATTSQIVAHNLGYKPIVQVIDSLGVLVIPDTVTHNTDNQFTVTFSVAFTGTILHR